MFPGRRLQIVVDVLCSPSPARREYDAAAPPMPVHFSNPDVLWKAEHPFSRFGQGAFKIALKALYVARLRSLRVPDETVDERVGASLKQWGKPTAPTYRYVEQRLARLNGQSITRYYMVGDNPASDMEGVRRANIFHATTAKASEWTSILVRTGVYSEGDETNGAHAVVDGVKEAVEYILAREAGFRVLSDS